jgi:Na+-translocating ferredoxin:NAD+ oxidoreductase subunit G
MQRLLAIGGKLALICTVAALILALVNAVTAPVIEQNRIERLNRTLSEIVGDQSVGERRNVDDHPVVQGYYPISGSDSYVLDLIGSGYGGDMRILAGYRSDGEVFAARLMRNNETPGLGKQAEEPGYMEKYTGHGDEEPIPTRPDQLPPEQADSVSGATITFISIGEALAAGSDFLENSEALE